MRLLQFCFVLPRFLFLKYRKQCTTSAFANPPPPLPKRRLWRYFRVLGTRRRPALVPQSPSPPIPQSRSSRVYLFIAVDIKWMEWNEPEWEDGRGWLPHCTLKAEDTRFCNFPSADICSSLVLRSECSLLFFIPHVKRTQDLN